MLLPTFRPVRRHVASLVGALLVASTSLAFASDPYVFTHFTGSLGGAGAVDGTGVAARFYRPGGVAVDGAGNIFVADTGNHTIREITPAGVVTTFAGLAGVAGTTDGTGDTARFDSPGRMAFDSAGNLFVPDSHSHVIRKITPAGVVTTFAGTAGMSGSTDGTGASARFNSPSAVAIDSANNLYVADSGNDVIRKITAAGAVTTFAGTAGSTGSADGTGAAARFFSPDGVVVDAAGNVYVTDTANQTIRKITPARVVTTLAGSAGSAGSINGTGANASFSLPEGITIDAAGTLYVAEGTTIRQVTSAGVVTTLAGSASASENLDGTGTSAHFIGATAIAAAPGGVLYVVDEAASTVRKISAGAVVTTLAGSVGAAGSADGSGTDARFSYPYGVAVDAAGNVYVSEVNNHTIRKITPARVVTTLAGLAGTYGSADGTGSAARFHAPFGIAADASGNVFVADYWNSTIRKITPAGVVTTLAGSAGQTGDADGTGSAARFSGVTGLAIDASGNLYATSSASHTIRKITPGGVVTTFAGSAGQQGDVDGVGAAARFNHPYGIAADTAGNLYVTESSGVVRKITTAGAVTTLAGAAGQTGSADGLGAAARFGGPVGVAVDGAGNVIVADSYNHTLRQITPAGEVTTIGGVSGHSGATDGTGTGATFNFPCGVAVDGGGHLYVADSGNNAIRRGATHADAAPTIDAFHNHTIRVSSRISLAFKVGDADTPANALTVTAGSSNSAFIPVSRIVFGGSGANRMVTLTPNTGVAGSSRITLTVSDGYLSSSVSFTLAAKGAPTINAFHDHTIRVNSHISLTFYVSDPDTPAGDLTVTAASSDPAFLPLSRIVLGGTGSTRTVTLTPAAGAAGSSKVTLTVSDGTLSNSISFQLTAEHAPTMNVFHNHSIRVNSHITLGFTVGDADDSAGSLSLSATSSNPALVPVSRIYFSGTGAARTVRIVPVPNMNGSARITLIVSDGSLRATRTFTLKVGTNDQRPTLPVFHNHTIRVNSHISLGFTVGDPDTPVANLKVSASSSNPTLLPLSRIVFSGSGASRKVTLTPAAGQHGSVNVTVTVSDGELTASRTFVLTAGAPDAAPTINAFHDHTIHVNSHITLNFTVGDADGPAASLVVTAKSSNPTLVPVSRVVLSGTGSARSVRITPAAGQSGSAKITLTVSDGTMSNSIDFVLKVIR